MIPVSLTLDYHQIKKPAKASFFLYAVPELLMRDKDG